MSDESYDLLRRALLSALGPKPSPEQRRKIAADLRALAEQQERMAARDTATPAEGQRAPGRARAEPDQPAGFYLRISREQDPLTGAVRLRVSIGRSAWSALGSPERIEVQRAGSDIWVVPAKGAAGAQLSIGSGLPSCVMPEAGPLAGLPSGRYAVTMRAGAIVVGARVG